MNRKTLTLTQHVPQHIPLDDVIDRICGHCRFYDDAEGLCRKRSPYRDADTGYAIWPVVNDSDWCGDYKRLPVVKA